MLEETNFVEKISDFVEWYSIRNPNNTASEDNEGTSVVDKKMVLDLCAHMFHPKDSSHDISGTMEYNEQKQEEKIKEFENIKGDAI